MSNKFIPKFVVAFSMLAMLLIFLGVNSVHRSYASSSTQKNVMDSSKYAMPDHIERHLRAVSNPVGNTSLDWIERHLPTVPKPARNSSPDWIDRHPPIIAKPVDYAGTEETTANAKVAPVFDATGAIISDPTGTMLNTDQSRDLLVPVTGADMKIAPVFDATGAIISDPTGTMVNASQSGGLVVPVTGTDMKIAPVFDATGAVVSDPTGTILSVINP